MSLPQPVPPSWKDLGKSSGDLLQKDYPFTGTALEIKTKTPSNVTFKVAGNRASSTSVIVGDLEAKLVDKKHGLTITNTWTTSNVLKNLVEVDNQIAQGLKVDLATSLAPAKEGGKGNRSAVLSAIYKQSGFHSRAFLDVLKGPTFTADTVIGRDGFLLGVEAAYNVTEGKINRYALAAGFNAPEYAVTLHALNDLKSFSASYYHRVSKDVEAGAKAVYDPKLTNGGVAIEVGTKTYLDNAAFVKAKINNAGVLALGYTQSLRPGLKASFGVAVDTQKLNEVDPVGHVHKVGLSFVFES
ncbi:voltage-dependent ion-selective channel [Roridomyces roridus]|jgi:voltage-dependent anion channel protein 2|uniref:Voltage-dependent ion-selective channel n=1 Tax=Roridomyces roridus TaxID=1738132 RepID=A0AAD7CB55_9AGAR|nr:voltage-dependent ion-selective channel [Roridomyces roridus]